MKQTIISFTAIPPRFSNLGAKFKSLEQQTVRPDRVQLTLPKTYRRFPGERPSLPSMPDWVEVFECDFDYGPATKLLPAVQRWAGTDSDLLICDDDRLQDKDWVSRFKKVREQRQNDIVCERGWNIQDRFGLMQQSLKLPRAERNRKEGRTFGYRLKRLCSLNFLHPPRQVYFKPGYVDVFEGFLGALIPVKAIPPSAFDIPGTIWTVDDVWISGMAALTNTYVWAHDMERPVYSGGKFDKLAALKDHVENGVTRDSADKMAVEHLRNAFGAWM